MVKPAFQNLPIECWIHPGRLGTAQPSVCLFHNSTLMGIELLDALDELMDEECPAQRTLTFATCSRESRVTKLKVIVVHERDDLKVMNIRRDAETAIIEVTALGLSLLVSAITSWLAGAEDFGVSPCHSSLKAKEFGTLDRNSGELWFWGPGYAGP